MSGPIPAIFGIPFDFLLFGAILAGIAAFHRRALFITLGGLAAILLYQATLGGFPTGYGLHAFGEHLAHEWVILSNLFLLLLGFEIVANQFEKSNISDHLPDHLPNNWSGGALLLTIIFVLAAFLDNIAAAVLGGVMARHLYKGRVTVGFIAAIVAVSNAGGAGSVTGRSRVLLRDSRTPVSQFAVAISFHPPSSCRSYTHGSWPRGSRWVSNRGRKRLGQQPTCQDHPRR